MPPPPSRERRNAGAGGLSPAAILLSSVWAASLAPLFRAELHEARPAVAPLTDDRAPVEWLTDRMIVDYVAAGGRLHELALPTKP